MKTKKIYNNPFGIADDKKPISSKTSLLNPLGDLDKPQEKFGIVDNLGFEDGLTIGLQGQKNQSNFYSKMVPAPQNLFPSQNLVAPPQNLFSAPFENNNNSDANNHKNESSRTNSTEEPPLLEDIGIDIQRIKEKILAVIYFKKLDQSIADKPDMFGAVFIAFMLGVIMIFKVKFIFGYIYGFGLVGSIILHVLLNLISHTRPISLYMLVSALGYCLLPLDILCGISVLINMKNILGFTLSAIFLGWACYACSNLVESILLLQNQKWVVFYPIFLFYMVFLLMVVFLQALSPPYKFQPAPFNINSPLNSPLQIIIIFLNNNF